jgi:hypothetical protein
LYIIEVDVSQKVRMFHRHIVAFLNHWIFISNVGPWSHHYISSWWLDITVETLILESPLTSIENYSIFQVSISGLTVSLRSSIWLLFIHFLITVFTWSWNFKLQTLTIEYLISIESRRCHIEAHFLTRESLIVGGPHLLCPLRSFIQVGNHTSCAYSCRIITNVNRS